MKKRLYKSSKDKKMSGVLAGVAEYFGVDATLVRLLFIILMISTGVVPFVFGYLLMHWIIPKHKDSNDKNNV